METVAKKTTPALERKTVIIASRFSQGRFFYLEMVLLIFKQAFTALANESTMFLLLYQDYCFVKRGLSVRKQFAVIGLGHFGASVAKSLSRMGHEVLAIDTSEARIQEISEHVTHAVQANAIEEETLRALGIRNFDAVIVAIGDDIQASVLVAVMLKEMGVKYIVAKAQNELHGKTLSKIGVDKVVYPEREMGEKLASNLSSSDILQYLELSDQYSIAEVVVHPKITNQSLGKLNLHSKYGIIVMAVKSGDEIIVAPGADVIVKEGDIICVMGAKRSIENLDKAI